MRSLVFKNIGILLSLFSLSMLPPLAVSWFANDGNSMPFLHGFLFALLLGLILWLPQRNNKGEMRLRDGFLLVALFWTVLSAVGAVPLWLSSTPDLRPVDALFEAMSGLTTTGATVLTGLDQMPASILYYRQQLQWMGGMGIIVLAVAVMPMLGIGGMQLYRAEMTGPVKDNRLAPRITETAKRLWYIYVALTIVCMVAYWLAGMSWFDALGHAFSTIATAGFSTHDANLAWFDGMAVDIVAGVFMLLSGFNFALHFAAFRSRRLQTYLADPEARAYLVITLVVSAVCIAVLAASEFYGSLNDTIVKGVVQVISILTTSGFTTTDFYLWPSFLPILMILIATIGGCGASTAGGMKVVRVLLLFKQGYREIFRLVHPSAVVPIKLGGKPVGENVTDAVWGFLSLYVLSYVILLLCMLATGVDLTTAFSTVSASLANLGPALGDAAINYAPISDTGKLILLVAMLMGRLELFTLLVLFTPAFWKS